MNLFKFQGTWSVCYVAVGVLLLAVSTVTMKRGQPYSWSAMKCVYEKPSSVSRSSYRGRTVRPAICTCNSSICIMDLDTDPVLRNLSTRRKSHNLVKFQCLRKDSTIHWKNQQFLHNLNDISITNCHVVIPEGKSLFFPGTVIGGVLLTNTFLSNKFPTFFNWSISSTLIISNGHYSDPDQIIDQLKIHPLRYLLNGVKMTKVPSKLAGSSKVVILDISKNQLTKDGLLSENKTYNCQTLIINNSSFNDLRGYVFKGKVGFLYLLSVKLQSFDMKTFNSLSNLKELHLDHNQLKSLPGGAFASLTELSTLTLSNNQIRTIEMNTFLANRQLISLSLKQNLIRHIQFGTFSQNQKLDFLDLSRNQLTSIPVDVLYGKSLNSIQLSHNSITWNHTIAELSKT